MPNTTPQTSAMDKPPSAAAASPPSFNTHFCPSSGHLGYRPAGCFGVLADHFPEAVACFDTDLRLTYVNEKIALFSQEPAASLVGKTLAETTFAIEVVHRLETELRAAFADANTHIFELELKTRSGQRDFTITLVPERTDKDGPVDCMLVLWRDMTSDHDRERRLQESEERYRLLAENSTDMIVTHDLNGLFAYVSSAARALQGYEPEELIGRRFSDFVHPEDLVMVYEVGLATRIDGASRTIVFRLRRKDGSYIWVESTRQAIFDRLSGEVVGIQTTNRDVTARRLAEESLRRQADILNAVGQAIISTDLENRIVDLNRAAEQLFGWSAADIRGRVAGEVLVPPTAQALVQEVNETVHRGGRWEGEILGWRRDGRTFPAYLVSTPLFEVNHPPTTFVNVVTDLSERRRLEETVRQAQRLDSLGTLAAGIAHNLNNLLTPLTIGLDLLRSQDEPRRREELLERMDASCRRMADVIRHIGAFGQGTEGRRQPMSLQSLVSQAMGLLRETLPKSLKLKVDLGDSSCMVVGDSTQLHQVMMNLVLNARDAMPKGGTLSISVSRLELTGHPERFHPAAQVGGYALLTIADTGCGIQAELRDRVFDPFFTTKQPGQGTGLGLSTSVGILRGHGGFITVESTVGQGSTFRVFLPAAPLHEAAGVPTRPPVELAFPEMGTVLVVDDEPAIRQLCQAILERLGLRVLTASDGRQAVNRFEAASDEIGLVVMDMWMPELDGASAIRILRGIRPTLPVIAISGADSAAQLAPLRVNAFLSKPFSRNDLVEAVRRVLPTLETLAK